MTPASKILCPLDFGALAVLPHGQIVGFRNVFRTFGGCVNNSYFLDNLKKFAKKNCISDLNPRYYGGTEKIE